MKAATFEPRIPPVQEASSLSTASNVEVLSVQAGLWNFLPHTSELVVPDSIQYQ